MSAETASRDSSTIRRARRPEACNADGLPTAAYASPIAASATGSSGVVAAWSRYAVLTPPLSPPSFLPPQSLVRRRGRACTGLLLHGQGRLWRRDATAPTA